MMVSMRQVLPLLLVVVVFTMLLICRGLGLNNIMVPYDTRIIFITEIVLSFVAMAVFFAMKRHYSTEPLLPSRRSVQVFLSSDPTLVSITSFLTSYANVIALYIFGAGSIALNVSSIFYKSQCISSFDKNTFRFTDEQVRLATSVIKVLMVVLEIPLLHYMTTLTFAHKRHIAANVAVLVLIGANTALWLFNFLNESKIFGIFGNTYPNVSMHTVDMGTACLNDSSVAEVFSHTTMDAALFPFYMEFCIVAIEILAGVYFIQTVRHPIISQIPSATAQYESTIQTVLDFTNTQNTCLVPKSFQRIDDNENFDQEDIEVDETSPLIHVDQPTVQRAGYRQMPDAGGAQEVSIVVVHPAIKMNNEEKPIYVRAWSIMLVACNPLTAMIVGIVEVLLMKYFLMHVDLVSDAADGYISEEYFYLNIASPLVVITIVFDALPMLIVTINCCVILSKCSVRRPNPAPMRTVIFVALIGISVLCCFKFIITCIKLGRSPDKIAPHVAALATLSLFETLLKWPQYYLQTILLYLGQRRCSDHSLALYGTLQGCFSYLAMNNFVHWMIGSFLETDYMRHRQELQDVEGWDTLVLLISPLLVYFFFVCTFLLVDLKSKLRERSPARWQLDLSITSLRPHLR